MSHFSLHPGVNIAAAMPVFVAATPAQKFNNNHYCIIAAHKARSSGIRRDGFAHKASYFYEAKHIIWASLLRLFFSHSAVH